MSLKKFFPVVFISSFILTNVSNFMLKNVCMAENVVNNSVTKKVSDKDIADSLEHIIKKSLNENEEKKLEQKNDNKPSTPVPAPAPVSPAPSPSPSTSSASSQSPTVETMKPKKAKPKPVFCEKKSEEQSNNVEDSKKDEINLPEVSSDEVGKFNSRMPSSEKTENKEYVIRGLIAMMLVIAGIILLAIVIITEVNSKKNKYGKRSKYGKKNKDQ